ncbi:MAG: hypothetical protein AAB466_05075 [Verrucomicrobiota bacterium]
MFHSDLLTDHELEVAVFQPPGVWAAGKPPLRFLDSNKNAQTGPLRR